MLSFCQANDTLYLPLKQAQTGDFKAAFFVLCT